MDIEKIKELALANGFSLKPQASGNMDLHSYVYQFAEAIAKEAVAQAVPEGFVVLKTSDVREVLSNASDAMDAESPSSVFTQTGNPSTWYDHHLVAEKNILDAIKAQEQCE